MHLGKPHTFNCLVKLLIWVMLKYMGIIPSKNASSLMIEKPSSLGSHATDAVSLAELQVETRESMLYACRGMWNVPMLVAMLYVFYSL